MDIKDKIKAEIARLRAEVKSGKAILYNNISPNRGKVSALRWVLKELEKD